MHIEDRVQTVMKRLDREEKSARKLVKRMDKERRAYFEFFTDILLYSIFQLFVLPTTDLSLSDIIWLLSLVILIYFLCLLKVFIAIISRE